MDLEQFKFRLAQTIVWSAPRADIENPVTSLRTAQLRAAILEANRFSTVDRVADARELHGWPETKNATLPHDLAGGRWISDFLQNHVAFTHSIRTRSLRLRPKVSGWYISSAFAGGTTNCPSVVARTT